jgi:hypothetical protein
MLELLLFNVKLFIVGITSVNVECGSIGFKILNGEDRTLPEREMLELLCIVVL